MAYTLGAAEKYTVEGIVFRCKPDFDIRRAHTDMVRANLHDPEATDAVNIKRFEAREEAAFEALRTAIVSIEELVDAKGAPVTKWSEKVRGQLPEPLTEELLTRVLRYLSDDRVGEAEAATEETPAP